MQRPATATMIRKEWKIRFEFDIDEKFSQKEIRTPFWMNGAGIFPGPAESGTLGKVAFENGPVSV